MKSDTWMAFYVGDYLANTLHLAREHHGSYLLLLLAAFKNAGWLPNDDGLLSQIAKATIRQWKSERPMYARFFEVTSERWTHKRVTVELAKAARLTEQRRLAGIESAARRQRERNERSTSVALSLQQKAIPSEPQEERLEETPSGFPLKDIPHPSSARGSLEGSAHDTATVLSALGASKRA